MSDLPVRHTLRFAILLDAANPFQGAEERSSSLTDQPRPFIIVRERFRSERLFSASSPKILTRKPSRAFRG
jgi:hypothetical protein